MKKTLVALLLIFSVSVLGKVDENNKLIGSKFSKEVTVNGMVCAFCSNSLEKKFKKEKAVEEVKVDLDKKKVSVKFKKGKSITDKELTRIIASSGFTVVDIKNSIKTKKPKETKKNAQK